MTKHITPDTLLFLFNFQLNKMMGPFMPLGPPEEDIVPSAFNRRFRAQVKVAPVDMPVLEVTPAAKTNGGPLKAHEVEALKARFMKGQAARDSVQKAWSDSNQDQDGSPGGPLTRQPSSVGGGPLARQPSLNGGSPLARQPSFAGGPGPPIKRSRTGPTDMDGRPYDFQTVVVNFANVGASYAEKVLG